MRVAILIIALTASTGSSAAASQTASRAFVQDLNAVGDYQECGVDRFSLFDSVRSTLLDAGYTIEYGAGQTFSVELDAHKGTAGGCSARVKVLRETLGEGKRGASEAEVCGWARVLASNPAVISRDLADYASTFTARCIRRDQEHSGIAGRSE